jgi:hypothetical protein
MKYISFFLVFLGAFYGSTLLGQAVFFLKPKDITDSNLTITAPGTYIFTDDVYFTRIGQTAISVWVDNVIIDLDGKTLRATNPGGQNIAIHLVRAPNSQVNSNRKNITIRNGNIANFNVHSVWVDPGSTNIVLENLNILSSNIRGATALTPNGIFLDGVQLSTVRTTDIMIKNCTVNNSRFGLRSRAADKVTIIDSVFNNNGSRGISSIDGNDWEVINCQASKQQVSDELGNFGLLVLGGSFWKVKNSDFSFNTITQTVNTIFPSVGGAQFQQLIDLDGNTLVNSSAHIIDNCTFNNNSTTIAGTFGRGLAMVGTDSCVIRNCIANGNTSIDSFQAGILDQGSISNFYEHCVAAGNAVTTVSLFGTFGFVTAASRGAYFGNCRAINNLEPTAGFGAGFFIDGASSNCLVQNCSAITNDPEGFVNSSLTSVFIGNLAFANPFNYVAFAPLGFITVVNGVQPPAGSFDERQIDNISIV